MKKNESGKANFKLEGNFDNINMDDIKKCHEEHHHKCHSGHSSDAVYGLGFIGAAVYYISTATGFWMGVLGFLKAIVWPAFLVFGLLKSLGL
jgi:hypothetical protein